MRANRSPAYRRAQRDLRVALRARGKQLGDGLEGEPPHDIYVPWEEGHEQPRGWAPDLNDGVRLNIRPFVTAGILRADPNIRWGIDRGTNPDGTRRDSDVHLALAQKQAARELAA